MGETTLYAILGFIIGLVVIGSLTWKVFAVSGATIVICNVVTGYLDFKNKRK